MHTEYYVLCYDYEVPRKLNLKRTDNHQSQFQQPQNQLIGLPPPYDPTSNLDKPGHN